MNETWSDDPEILASAIRDAEGRVFQTRDGARVDDVDNIRGNDSYPGRSETTGYWYTDAGRLYDYAPDPSDIVSVLLVATSIVPDTVEHPDNPDYLRLLSYAKNEDAADIIAREYVGYRLLDTLHLKMLGHTGKRKQVSWDTVPKLRELLDFDRMFDAIPWTISQGEAIHDVFEKHRPGSCMRDTCKRELRQIYVLNPDQVKTAHHAKGLCGLLQSSISCLVWYGKDTIYIDRRYCDGYLPGIKDPLIRSLKRQLETAGKPVLQVWKGDNIVGVDCIEKPIQFCLDRDGDYMPWCDSIRYVVEYDDDTVTLSTSERSGREICQDQSGYDITQERMKCCECGCRWSEDDDRLNDNGDRYCESCWSDNYSRCEWSEEDCPTDKVDSVRVYSYDSRYRQRRPIPGSFPAWSTMSICDDVLRDDFTKLSNGSYCHNDLVVEDNRGNYHAPDSDDYVTTEDGEPYNPNDVVQLVNGECHPTENCIEVDGAWYVDGTEPSVETVETEVSE